MSALSSTAVIVFGSIVVVCIAFVLGAMSPIKRASRRNTPPEIPNPPAPPPKLSCFVRGLIKSMETETQKWEQCLFAHYSDSVYRHADAGISVHYRYYSDGAQTALLVDMALTDAETAALTAVVLRRLEEPRLAAIRATFQAERQKYDEKVAKSRAHFESLGCPQVEKSGVEA